MIYMLYVLVIVYFYCFIVFIHKKSINKDGFLRNFNRKYWPVTVCNSISEHHDLDAKCS